MATQTFVRRSFLVLAAVCLVALPAAGQVLPYPSVELGLSGGEDRGHGGMLIAAGEKLTLDLDVRGQGTLYVALSASENWGRIDTSRMAFWSVPAADQLVRYEFLVPKHLAGFAFTVQAALVTDEGFAASEVGTIMISDADRARDALDPKAYGFSDAPEGAARPALPEAAGAAVATKEDGAEEA